MCIRDRSCPLQSTQGFSRLSTPISRPTLTSDLDLLRERCATSMLSSCLGVARGVWGAPPSPAVPCPRASMERMIPEPVNLICVHTKSDARKLKLSDSRGITGYSLNATRVTSTLHFLLVVRFLLLILLSMWPSRTSSVAHRVKG